MFIDLARRGLLIAYTTLTLGVAGCLNSKLKLDLGIETLGCGTAS